MDSSFAHIKQNRSRQALWNTITEIVWNVYNLLTFFVHLDEYDLNPDKAVLEGVRRMLERVEQCLMVNSVTDIKKCEN